MQTHTMLKVERRQPLSMLVLVLGLIWVGCSVDDRDDRTSEGDQKAQADIDVFKEAGSLRPGETGRARYVNGVRQTPDPSISAGAGAARGSSAEPPSAGTRRGAPVSRLPAPLKFSGGGISAQPPSFPGAPVAGSLCPSACPAVRPARGCQMMAGTLDPTTGCTSCPTISCNPLVVAPRWFCSMLAPYRDPNLCYVDSVDEHGCPHTKIIPCNVPPTPAPALLLLPPLPLPLPPPPPPPPPVDVVSTCNNTISFCMDRAEQSLNTCLQRMALLKDPLAAMRHGIQCVSRLGYVASDCLLACQSPPLSDD